MGMAFQITGDKTDLNKQKKRGAGLTDQFSLKINK